jgi:hypothetical protein
LKDCLNLGGSSNHGLKIPDGVKNDSYNLANLKEPVTWYGDVAVGADRRFVGWWNVVPPNGIQICFCGKDAEEKAKKLGQDMKDHYK